MHLVFSVPDSLSALPIDLDIQEVRQNGTFEISIRQAKEYVRGRAVLAGDAAHAHSPVGGRGMNLCIDDGRALAAAIISGEMEAYEQDRQAKARHVINYTERARKMVKSTNPLVGTGLHTLGWFVNNVRFIRRQFVKKLVRL